MLLTKVGLFIVLFACTFRSEAQAADLDVDFSLLGDTAHFEFTGREHWTYELEKKSDQNQSKIEVRVPRLSETAIGRLKAIKGGPIRAVKIQRGGPDGSDLVEIQLVIKDIESFDYLTDQPSRLIIDLYPEKKKSAHEKSDSQSGSEVASQPTEKSGTGAAKTPKPTRKIATTDVLIVKNETLEDLQKSLKPGTSQGGIFDGSDPDFGRFSIQDYEIRDEAIIQSREKDYIDFPMLHIQPDEYQVMDSRKPVYEIEPELSKDPKAQDENKMARLLLTLFTNKRYLVFLKTIDWFFEKYPNSKYDEIVRYMWADTHYALYNEDRQKNHSQFDLAMFRYREALQKYPESPLAERTMLWMGYASLDRGDFLGTLRLFQQHLAKRPSSVNKDLSRLAIAEAFLKLNQYDEAAHSFEEIEKDAKRPEDRIRAAYLKGDVYFQKKDDPKAVASYQDAVKKYPSEQKDFPNASYNIAAASFRQGEFKTSLAQYRDFLKRFPSHSYAGYAMTRVGELLDILGADSSRVMGAYLEAYFRYGDSPSALVARLRLLTARMKGMKPKEQEKAVSDINELAAHSDLPKIDQLATLLIGEGLRSRGQYDDAIKLLVKYYQEHVTTADTQRLQSKIERNINEKLREQVISGKFIDALKTHDQYADNWLKGSERIDTKYWVGRAFEQAGVFKESAKLYRDTLNKEYEIKGTSKERERSIFEKLPTTDELHLRLGAALFQQSQWSQAFDQLKSIEKPEMLSETDQIERVQMGAALLDKKGESELALRYLAELIKTWKGVPSLATGLYFDAGEIEMKLGKSEDAMKSFTRVDELMKDSHEVSENLHASSLEKLAQMHLQAGHKDKAVQALEKLLKSYEKTRPLASWRYKMGEIFFDRGEVQKAAEIWNELKGEKSNFWSGLAQEKLKGSAWGEDYKKYIQRIPAMSEKE